MSYSPHLVESTVSVEIMASHYQYEVDKVKKDVVTCALMWSFFLCLSGVAFINADYFIAAESSLRDSYVGYTPASHRRVVLTSNFILYLLRK